MSRLAYSPEEVADMLPLSANTIRTMVRDGRLKRVPNTGRKVCIAATEIESVFGVELAERAS